MAYTGVGVPRCDLCGPRPRGAARAVLAVDFLLVRGQEVPEETVVCDYAPPANLLNGCP